MFGFGFGSGSDRPQINPYVCGWGVSQDPPLSPPAAQIFVVVDPPPPSATFVASPLPHPPLI